MTTHPCPYCGRPLGQAKVETSRHIVFCPNVYCPLNRPIAGRTLSEALKKAKKLTKELREMLD